MAKNISKPPLSPLWAALARVCAAASRRLAQRVKA